MPTPPVGVCPHFPSYSMPPASGTLHNPPPQDPRESLSLLVHTTNGDQSGKRKTSDGDVVDVL